MPQMSAQQLWSSYQPHAGYNYAYPYAVPSYPSQYAAAASAPTIGMPYTYAQAAYAGGGFPTPAAVGNDSNPSFSNVRYDGASIVSPVSSSSIAYTQLGPPTKKRLTSEDQLSAASTPIHSHSYASYRPPSSSSSPSSAYAATPTTHTQSSLEMSNVQKPRTYGGGQESLSKSSSSASTSSSSTSSTSTSESKWPPSLMAFVTRCYEQTNPSDYPAMEKKLAEMVKMAEETKTLWSRDWANMSLPVKSGSGGISPFSMNFSSSSPSSISSSSSLSPMPSTSHPPPVAAKKTKLVSSSTHSGNRPLSKKEKRKANAASSAAAAAAAAAAATIPVGLIDEEEKREWRASRFRDSSSQSHVSSLSSSSHPSRYAYSQNVDYEEVGDDSATAFVGTSTALEKPYLRLTDRPIPSSVRSVHVLKHSLELMRRKKREGASWTAYLGEQMKSIRQDLVIQSVTDEFALEVYETNARWCLENNDVAEFKRCLLRIDEFYNHLNITSSNMDEFYCYSLLYNLLSEDFPALNAELATLGAERRAHPAIAHAVQVCEAYLDNNWHAFFRLSKNPYFLTKHILDIASERLRINALKSVLVSYVPFALPPPCLHVCMSSSQSVTNFGNSYVLNSKIPTYCANGVACKSAVVRDDVDRPGVALCS